MVPLVFLSVEDGDLIPYPLSVFGMDERGFGKAVPFTIGYEFIVEGEELCSGFQVEYKFLKGISVWHFAFHIAESLSSIEHFQLISYGSSCRGMVQGSLEIPEILTPFYQLIEVIEKLLTGTMVV